MGRSVVGSFVILGLLVGGPVWAGNTITVNSTNDPGSPGICTLRDAIQAAETDSAVNGCPAGSGADTVDLTGVTGTVTLVSGELLISTDVTITGPGATQLAINGNSNSRVFDVTAGTLTISDATIQNGRSYGWPGGGGVYVASGASLAMTNITLSSNAADSGGGIFNSGSATLTNSTLSGNGAYSRGGGLCNYQGSAMLSNSTLSGNGAYYGGSLYNSYGSAMLSNSTLSGNGAYYGGGIYNDYYGSATLSNSTVSGNWAYSGGGIYNNSYGSATLTNSTLSGNWAYSGGGIYNDSYGSAMLTNSTLSGNWAYSGGGIYNDYYGSATLANTIVAKSPSGGDCSGGVSSGGHNLDDDNTCFTDPTDLHAPPELASLGNYGGPTQTMALCTGVSVPDASCTGVSPALNTGGNVACPSTDQRGFTRPQPPGGTCDIGAYEVGCGDAVRDNSEQCDDANGSNADMCLNTCLTATCGDGFVCSDAGCTTGPTGGTEQCDNGAANSNNGPCLTTCVTAMCGDGLLCSDPSCTSGAAGGPEQCDAGAANSLSGACLPTCQVAANDDDGDGVSNGTEVNAPNGGDGNGDGTQDSVQSNVASLPEATSSNYVTVVSNGGTCGRLQNVQTLGSLHPAADRNFSYPFGMVGFTIPCSPAGGTVRVTVIFHGQTTVPPGVVYRKYGPLPPAFNHPQYYTLPNVQFSVGQVGTTSEMALMARFDITDGGVGDGTVQDGTIVDPGGAAVPIQSAVPVASPVGVALLVLALSVLGAARMRRVGA